MTTQHGLLRDVNARLDALEERSSKFDRQLDGTVSAIDRIMRPTLQGPLYETNKRLDALEANQGEMMEEMGKLARQVRQNTLVVEPMTPRETPALYMQQMGRAKRVGRQDAALVECLAEYAHEAWSGWMKYLFELSLETGDGCEEIQRPQVERWTRQMNTPYEDLPEEEKISDREEAVKILELIQGWGL